MADAPALGAGVAKATWRFDPSLAYQADSLKRWSEHPWITRLRFDGSTT